jgi:hypothetical protein
VIKLTSRQHKPREPRPARLPSAANAASAATRRSRHPELQQRADRSLGTLPPSRPEPGTHAGPLAWVSTLDGYRLAGRHLLVPAETGLMGSSFGQGQSSTGEGTP